MKRNIPRNVWIYPDDTVTGHEHYNSYVLCTDAWTMYSQVTQGKSNKKNRHAMYNRFYNFSNVGVRFCNPENSAAWTSFVCSDALFHTPVYRKPS